MPDRADLIATIARIIAPETFDPFLPASVMKTWKVRAIAKAEAILAAIEKEKDT